jgi:hypothetical protein
MRALALVMTFAVTAGAAHAADKYRPPSTYRAVNKRNQTRGGVLGLASTVIAKIVEYIPEAPASRPIVQRLRRAGITALQGGILELPLMAVGGPLEWIGSGVNLSAMGYQMAHDLAPKKMMKLEHHVGGILLGAQKRGLRDRFVEKRYEPLRERIDRLDGKSKREVEANANALWDATRKLNNAFAFKTSVRHAAAQARVVKRQLDRYEASK